MLKKITAASIHRKDYISFINTVFKEKFENMDDFKHENNFKKVINQLDLNDVRTAISNAKEIESNLKSKGHQKLEYKKYEYYNENPSCSIHVYIEKILKICGLD